MLVSPEENKENGKFGRYTITNLIKEREEDQGCFRSLHRALTSSARIWFDPKKARKKNQGDTMALQILLRNRKETRLL